MERRTFLKNIFGAAVVAAMPAILVRQIEELPPEKILSARLHNLDEPGQICHDNCMYIHDGENLLAASRQFNLVFKNHLVDVTNAYSEYPEYVSGYREWKVWGENVMWLDGDTGMNHLMDHKPLYCLIYHGGSRIVGQVYITECSVSAPMYDHIELDVMMTGSGELIVDTNDDCYEYPRIEKQIREAEGEKIAVRLESELFKGGHKKLKA